MSSGNSAIQFYGKENVLNAYANSGTPGYAIWQGKQLITKYDGWDKDGQYIEPSINEGMNMLSAFMDAMYQGTTAIYTLKLYDLTKQEKIKPSTEYDTAFNFRLFAPIDMMGGMMPGMYGGRPQPPNMILDEIRKINERIDAMNGVGEDDEEEADESLDEYIMGLIKDPLKMNDAVNSWKNLFGLPITHGAETAALGTTDVKRITSSEAEMTEEEKLEAQARIERLGIAINTLEKNDPHVVENLEKLASVADTDPERFKKLIAALKFL